LLFLNNEEDTEIAVLKETVRYYRESLKKIETNERYNHHLTKGKKRTGNFFIYPIAGHRYKYFFDTKIPNPMERIVQPGWLCINNRYFSLFRYNSHQIDSVFY
jgi:hypothetical protein